MSYCLPTILMSTVLSLSLPMDNCTPTGQINKHRVCTCTQKRKKKLVKVVMMQCCQQVANRPCITTNIITNRQCNLILVQIYFKRQSAHRITANVVSSSHIYAQIFQRVSLLQVFLTKAVYTFFICLMYAPHPSHFP